MRPCRLLLSCVLAALAAAWPVYAGAQDRSALVQQKLRLLDGLLRSPRAAEIAAGADAGAKARYQQARRIFEEADALHAANPAQAEPLLDSALRLISGAGAGGTGELARSRLRRQNAELAEQLGLYRQMVADAAQRRPDPELRSALERVDELSALAAAHAGAGRLGDSNRMLAQACQAAIAAVSKVRAGETVVIDLKFATPADEYAYEQRRFRSTLMLVELKLGEEGASADGRKAVEGLASKGRDSAAQAEALAAKDEHAGAIRLMEEASRHLTRALQLLGVPAF